ncbi:MAG: class I SAM-dependent methyltransferase [Bryobacterales bacterium]|nr:class I SAM-dependent methyltransferase [Bryobacterales bacterium]
MKRWLKALAARAGYAVLRTRGRYWQDGLFTLHGARFRAEARFRAAYARGVAASQGHDPEFEWRIHVALWAARLASHVPGDFVECGVNAGFVSSAIAEDLGWPVAGKRFHLVDTFAGPVAEQYSREEIAKGRLDIARDALAAGAYVTDAARVRAQFAAWPGVVVVQGAVPGVLSALDVDAVAFLHLDMNCAFPEVAALEYFWPRLQPGGVVLLDDYAYFGHEHQGDAIDAAARKLDASVLALPTGQGLIVKARRRAATS